MPSDSRKANVLAALIVTTLGIAWHLADDPQALGTEPELRTALLPEAAIDRTPAPISIEAQAGLAPLTPISEGGLVPPPSDGPVLVSSELLTGKWALQLNIALLREGMQTLEHVPDYTCTFWKQERVQGCVLDPQEVLMKVRHEPFSVYMKWIEGDKGRQLIFVSGQNNGNMLVQPGGITGRFAGTLEIDPNSSRATSESRYHIEKAGILNLARTIVECQSRELDAPVQATYELRDGFAFEDRPTFRFISEYADRQQNSLYSKSIIHVDKETRFPVSVQNYTWPDAGETFAADDDGLIEHYVFRNIELKRDLADVDFDKSNKKYRMR